MSEKIVKVTLVEEPEKGEEKATDLARLEKLASRLMEVEKLIDEFKAKLADAEEELKQFKSKSPLEKRFSELTGTPFRDLTSELEQKVKTLQEQLEGLQSERAKLRSEILAGLSKAIMPIETDGLVENVEEEVFFRFREGARYPAIVAFLKKELKFGVPPVYVTINPEGIKVVGLTERTLALKELVAAIENLHSKASNMLGPIAQPATARPTQTALQEAQEPTAVKTLTEKEEELIESNITGLFKKAKKRLATVT